MKKLTALANKNEIQLIYGDNVETILVSGITEAKIKHAFKSLGIDEESIVRFGVDNQTKPKILSVKHDKKGQLIIKTDKKEVIVKHPWLVTELDQGFQDLQISADDFEAFCQELEKHGLPRPANAGLISGAFREELTLPNLNCFDIPIEESKTIDPSLFADDLTIGSLYAFPSIDSVSLNDLFQFGKKNSK